MKMPLSVRYSLVIILGILSCQGYARTMGDLEAVHMAAMQRTLVMQMSRHHLQLGAGLQQAGGQAALEQAVGEYERLLGELAHNATTEALQERVAKVKQRWQKFRPLVKAGFDPTRLEQLLFNADSLLVMNDLLLRDWMARLPYAVGKQMNLAQLQSMLAERMATLYLAQSLQPSPQQESLHLESDWLAEELQHAVAAFDAAMVELGDATQWAVDHNLMTQLHSNWDYARFSLNQFNQDQYVPLVVSATLESMTEQTRQVATTYQIRDRIALSGGLMEAGLAANLPN